MKRRRIIKERSFSSDNALIKQALEAAIKAKQLLDDAAGTIRDAVGETFLFARLDSHSMDLDDTIDDIKAVLAGQLDATDDEYVLESRKRFGNKFVKESGAARKGLEELRDVLVNQFGQYSPEGFDDGLFIDDRVEKDDDGRDVLNVCEDPGFGCISQIMKYINQTYGKRFDMVLYKGKNSTNLDIYDLEGEEKDNEEPPHVQKDLPGQMTLPGFDESRKRFVRESSNGSKWFDEYGFLVKRIPQACIEDCSGSGQKDEAVAYWVDKLKFYIPDNLIEKALDYLREFGAWDEFELQEWADTEDLEHNIA